MVGGGTWEYGEKYHNVGEFFGGEERKTAEGKFSNSSRKNLDLHVAT